MHIRNALIVLLPAAVAIAACNSSDELTLNPVTDEAGFTVTVEELGSEPRQELRLTTEAGTTQSVTQTQDIGIDIEAGGESQTSQNPTTQIDITYTVAGVDGDRIRIEGVYDDVRVLETAGADPAAVQGTEEAMGSFIGATFLGTYTDRGSVVSVDFDDLEFGGAFAGMLDQLIESLIDSAESLSTPFPVEAVGVGGRWRVESSAELGGLPFEQTSIIEITELDADRLVGTIDQMLRFVEGEAEVFGSTVNVIGGEFAGGGSIEWDLSGAVLPYLDTSMVGTAILEAQGQRISQDQRSPIVIEPR